MIRTSCDKRELIKQEYKDVQKTPTNMTNYETTMRDMRITTRTQIDSVLHSQQMSYGSNIEESKNTTTVYETERYSSLNPPNLIKDT